jgi:hypothetical protein
MGCLITEINRFPPFRLISVTEIIPSPYKGGIVPAVIAGRANGNTQTPFI